MVAPREWNRSPRDWPTLQIVVEAVLVACILGAFVAYVAPTLDRPLLEKHAWRQTQTAYSARIFHEQGIDLLHPKLPVFGDPFEVPFEFPLLQAAASLLMDAGIEDDLAMRLTGLACFLATALLLYGLVRHVAGPIGALAAIVAFVMTPFSLVWARASMIEYLATAGAVGFTWAMIAWREKPRLTPAMLALVAGLIGMLVKPTTAIFWVLPALLYRPERTSPARARWVSVLTAALVVVPLAAAVVWTHHADAVKAASSTTSFLTSSGLQEWNLGTPSQRLDPDAWMVILKRLGPTVVGLYGLFLVAALIATTRVLQRGFWLGMWLAAFGPFLAFTNLYVQHDYYLAAVTPAFAALTGLGIAYVGSFLSRRPLIALAGLVAAVAFSYGTLELGRGYWLRIHGAEDDPQVMPLAAEVDRLTRPDELVAFIGLAWSPAIPYYSRRWGHMIVQENEPFAYDIVHDAGYEYLLVGDPPRTDLTPLERWRWLGSLASHSYALADSPRQLRGAPFIATDTSAPTRATIRRSVRVPCGQSTHIPAGRQGTWIRSRSDAPQALLTVTEDLAPLPVRPAMFVAAELAQDGRLELSCAGSPSLVIDVIDAPGP